MEYPTYKYRIIFCISYIYLIGLFIYFFVLFRFKVLYVEMFFSILGFLIYTQLPYLTIKAEDEYRKENKFLE